MARDASQIGAIGSGDDRLSAVMAAALVAANLVGGGMLGLLKALDVAPMADGRVTSREALTTWIGTARPADPSAIPARGDEPPGVARRAPADRGRWRR